MDDKAQDKVEKPRRKTDIDFSRPNLPWDVNLSAICGGYLLQVGCFRKMYPDTFKARQEIVDDLRTYLEEPMAASYDLNVSRESVGIGRDVPAPELPEMPGEPTVGPTL